MSESRRLGLGYLFLLITSLCWAGAWLTARVAAHDLPPLTVTWGRFLVATLALLPMRALLDRGRAPKWQAGDRRTLFFMSLTGIVGYNTLFMIGIARAPASDGAVMVPGLVGPLAMIIAAIAFRQRPRLNEVAGAASAGLGVLLVGWAAMRSAGDDPTRVQGDLIFVGAAVLWAIYTVLGRRLAGRIPAVTGILIVSAIGVVLLTPVVLLVDGVPNPLTWPRGGLGNILYLGLVGTAAGFVTYFLSVEILGVNRTMPGLGLVPFFGVLGAALLLDEQLTPLHALGGALVIAGIVLPALVRHARQVRNGR